MIPTSPSLQATDNESAAAGVGAPRVSLQAIEAAITSVEYLKPANAPTMTIACVTLSNGYVIIGKSAPASPENYSAEYGKQLAYEDAVRQIWPLMGFALRERLSGAPALR